MSVLPIIEGDVFVVYDKSAAAVAKQFLGAEKHLCIKGRLAVGGGEKVKSLAFVEKISTWLMNHEAGRDSVLLVIGGGSVCDAGAFAASIYKRGIRFILVPTTLLAQVDAAIGGKTAVNYGGVKNVLGTFAWPEYTVLNPEFIASLPDEEFISGCAELLKTFIISGTNYNETVELLNRVHAQKVASGKSLAQIALVEGIGPLIQEAAAIKTKIVEKDPYDKGDRQMLNLGHTFGHAIEAATGLAHGQAVAIGIVLSARLSEKLGLAEPALASALEKDLKAAGLQTKCPLPIEELESRIRQDKKATDGKITFILPVRPGKVEKVSLDLKVIYDLRPACK